MINNLIENKTSSLAEKVGRFQHIVQFERPWKYKNILCLSHMIKYDFSQNIVSFSSK